MKIFINKNNEIIKIENENSMFERYYMPNKINFSEFDEFLLVTNKKLISGKINKLIYFELEEFLEDCSDTFKLYIVNNIDEFNGK